MQNETFNFLISLVPIASIIIGLAMLKKPAYIIMPFSLILTAILAFIFKDFNLNLIIASISEGTLIAIWSIILVIIAGVFTYYMSEETKDIDIIKNGLSNVSKDRRVIMLLILWGFGTFLEGIAGYGVGIIIPLGILISMGFDAFKIALIALIFDTACTIFGSVGIPITILSQVSGIDVITLSFYVAKQLFIPVVIIPFVMVIMLEGFKGLKGVFIITILSGLSVAITQVIVSIYLGAELPVILGGLVCMLTIILYQKFIVKEEIKSKGKNNLKDITLAWLPYILIVFLIILVSPLFKGISNTLNNIKTTIQVVPNASPLVFKWITSPALIIIFSTAIVYLIRGVKPKVITNVFIRAVKKLLITSFVIICIVAISRILTFSNMILDLGTGIANITKWTYPFFSPLVGAIGTFITGSDVASNLIFGNLQVQVAEQLGLNGAWLASANSSGATAGKMLSPQNIAIATTASSLKGIEGKLLSKAFPYAIVYILICGLIVISLYPK